MSEFIDENLYKIYISLKRDILCGNPLYGPETISFDISRSVYYSLDCDKSVSKRTPFFRG